MSPSTLRIIQSLSPIAPRTLRAGGQQSAPPTNGGHEGRDHVRRSDPGLPAVPASSCIDILLETSEVILDQLDPGRRRQKIDRAPLIKSDRRASEPLFRLVLASRERGSPRPKSLRTSKRVRSPPWPRGRRLMASCHCGGPWCHGSSCLSPLCDLPQAAQKA